MAISDPLIPAQAGTQTDWAKQIDWAERMTQLGPRLRGDGRYGVGDSGMEGR